MNPRPTKCQAYRHAQDRVGPVYRTHPDEYRFDAHGIPSAPFRTRPEAIAARRMKLVHLACEHRGTTPPETLGDKPWQTYVV